MSQLIIDTQAGPITLHTGPTLNTVHEYSDDKSVRLVLSQGRRSNDRPIEEWCGHGKVVVEAIDPTTGNTYHNGTQVDLIELLTWVHKNLPGIWREISQS
jgi:hypothetical protein